MFDRPYRPLFSHPFCCAICALIVSEGQKVAIGLIWKGIIVAGLLWVAFHSYQRVRFLLRDKKWYVLFYGGIALAGAGVLLGEPALSLHLLSLAVLFVLGGTGCAIRLFKHQAIRDYLTGLSSRVYFFEEWFPREVKRQERCGGRIVFALLDIDNLKTLNDICGHRVGDEVLQLIADAIKRNIRATDLAVRFGGDEILLAFPGSDLDGARKIVERITLDIGQIKDPISVSLSAGFSEWTPGDDIGKVLREADLAMYREKTRKGELSLRHSKALVGGTH
ncbi:MAG TPA: GGDEF domain-containing protein [Peptococcaceae bacterium]|nr:GGDEF domain-containing protein [Peptococcaceae bacterium]